MAAIIYTHIDERRRCLRRILPPDRPAFARGALVEIETRDISLAGRILAQFGLADDALTELGGLAEGLRCQHRQAAEHLGLGAAAQGGHQGAAGAGLALPDYPSIRHDVCGG